MMALQKAVTGNVLFAHLESDELTNVLDAMFLVVKNAGDVIIQQGDDGDNFYIIDSGVVEVRVVYRVPWCVCACARMWAWCLFRLVEEPVNLIVTSSGLDFERWRGAGEVLRDQRGRQLWRARAHLRHATRGDGEGQDG